MQDISRLSGLHRKSTGIFAHKTLEKLLAPQAVVVTVLSLLALRVAIEPVVDPDFWWHLAYGNWILAHFRLPPHDLFTYTVANHKYVDHEWLIQVIYSVVYNHLGLAGISILMGLVTFLAFPYIYKTCKLYNANPLVTGCIMLLVVLDVLPVIGPRPQMISFALGSVLIYWISAFIVRDNHYVYAIPFLIIPWANLHPGFEITYAFLIAGIAALIIDGFLYPSAQHANFQKAKILGIILIASIIFALINPYGPSLLLNPFYTLMGKAQQNFIQEWASPNFHLLIMRPLEATILLGIGAFVLRRQSAYNVLMFVGTLVLTLESVRQQEFFALASAPVLAFGYSSYADRLIANLNARLGRNRNLSVPVRTVFSLLSVLTVSVACLYGIYANLARQSYLTQKVYPLGAVQFIESHPNIKGHMFNSYGFGGYLSYSLSRYPDHKVFIYGEATVMGGKLLRQYAAVVYLQPQWQQILKKYNVNYMILQSYSALANVMQIMPHWHVVYRDSTATILVRST